ELFKPYHFSEAVLSDLKREMNHGSGKQFFSGTHQLIIDREELILRPIEVLNNEQITISDLPFECSWFGKHYKIYTADFDEEIKENLFKDLFQSVDYDSIELPLTVRSWQDGDRFRPMGMQGNKKISDYLISLKVPLPEKRRVPVVLDSSK